MFYLKCERILRPLQVGGVQEFHLYITNVNNNNKYRIFK